MFGGPFYSAGAARIINGVMYRYRGVGYARWVTLMNGGHSADHFEIRRERRLVAKVPTREDVDRYFDAIAEGKPAPSFTRPRSGDAERGIRQLTGIPAVSREVSS